MKLLLLSFVCVFIFTACKKYECSIFIVPYNVRGILAQNIQQLAAAANPQSDEEPEDNILQAERTLTKIFSIEVRGKSLAPDSKCICAEAEINRALQDTTLFHALMASKRIE